MPRLYPSARYNSADTLELTQEEHVYTIGTSPIAIIGANPDRTSLLLQNIGTGEITISTIPGVPGGTGILLAAGSEPFIISDDRLPGLASRSFFAVASAAGASLEVISVRWT